MPALSGQVTPQVIITTLGDTSHDILAQSVSGTGGDGGTVAVTSSGTIMTGGYKTDGICARSTGKGGGTGGMCISVTGTWNPKGSAALGVSLGGSGGGGKGDKVTVANDGTIITTGDEFSGIKAQSVGGGGDGGFRLSGGISGTKSLYAQVAIGGSGGSGNTGGGGADNVAIYNAKGEIIGYLTDKQDTGGDINITLDGELRANGTDSNGIYLQSKGADGNGDISVSVTGLVQGGSGDSTGVRILDGASNTLDISGGSVTTLNGIDGTAIYTTDGDDTINNTGTVTGSVELGLGNNGFNNGETALINAGAVTDLGGGAFANAGIFSPGGSERVFTTDLNGALAQTGSGNYEHDYDIDAIEADRINVTGAADLSGYVSVSELNLGYAREETNELAIVSSSFLSQADMTLVSVPSVVLTHDLLASNQTDLVLRSNVDFTPDPPLGKRLKKNQRAIGNHIAAIQATGGSALFAPVAEAIFHQPDFDSLTRAYDSRLPALYLNADIATFYSSMNFHNALFSCPQRSGAHRFISEGECNWLSVAYNELDYALWCFIERIGRCRMAGCGVRGRCVVTLHVSSQITGQVRMQLSSPLRSASRAD